MADELERALAFLHAVEDGCATRRERFAYGVGLFHDRLVHVWDLNFLRVDSGEAAGVRADEVAGEAERLMAAFEHRKVHLDDELAGSRLEPGFRELGWHVQPLLVMARSGTPRRRVATETVREVRAESLTEAWEAGIRAEPWGEDDEVVGQLVDFYGVVAGVVATRYFAVLDGGVPVSHCELYEHDGVAQLESLVTTEEHRGRGHGSAVLTRAAEEAVLSGAELVFLVTEADDWPHELYRELGFQDVGLLYHFRRSTLG
jgi:ribosomal protein S18 acetylase RimI-like enzyme